MSQQLASGTQACTVGTKHSLSTAQTGYKRLQLRVDLGPMALGDTLEVGYDTTVKSGGTSREVILRTFRHVAADLAPDLGEIESGVSLQFFVRQTAGAGRSFDWEVLDVEPSAGGGSAAVPQPVGWAAEVEEGDLTGYVEIYAQTSAGVALTGKVAGDFTIYRQRGAAAQATWGTITLSEISAANRPGWYRLLVNQDVVVDPGMLSQMLSIIATASGGVSHISRVKVTRPTGSVGLFAAAGADIQSLVLPVGRTTAKGNLLEILTATKRQLRTVIDVQTVGSNQVATVGRPWITGQQPVAGDLVREWLGEQALTAVELVQQIGSDKPGVTVAAESFAVEPGVGLTAVLRRSLASMAGPRGVVGANDFRFKDPSGAKTRVRHVIDGNGNSTTVEYDDT